MKKFKPLFAITATNALKYARPEHWMIRTYLGRKNAPSFSLLKIKNL
jgi:hypothetical protein